MSRMLKETADDSVTSEHSLLGPMNDAHSQKHVSQTSVAEDVALSIRHGGGSGRVPDLGDRTPIRHIRCLCPAAVIPRVAAPRHRVTRLLRS